MSEVTQFWYDDKLEKMVDAEVMKRLADSAIVVRDEIVKNITEMHLIKKGHFRDSIRWELYPKRLTAKIGSPLGDLMNPKENPPYPLYLEFGTRNMPAFMPMRRGLIDARSRIQAAWR